MIMKYQFYPWTHQALASEIREKLGLPIDTPKKIEQGTMQRFENWIVNPPRIVVDDQPKVERILTRIQMANKPKH